MPEKAYAEHPGDFPEAKENMLKEQYPAMLITQAGIICKEAGDFLREILKPHAYLNLRRAQGLLNVLKKNRNHSALVQSCIKAKATGIVHPKKFEKLLDYEARQLNLNISIPISESGRAMIRDSKYYLN